MLWSAADPPDDEEDAGSRFAPEPWRGWSGLMAHPASRCGGGGPGVFRHASPLGSQVRLAYGLPHPQSPAARLTSAATLLLAKGRSLWGGSGGRASPKAPKNPPKTGAGKFAANIKMPPVGVDVNISIEILKDGIKIPAYKWALGETNCYWSEYGWFWEPPEGPVRLVGGVRRVAVVRKKPSVTATLIVHTTYRSEKSKKEKAGYGRGATREDKRNRNTSAAFHEWCHREDYRRYFEVHFLPGFYGYAGMTEKDFLDAWDRFQWEFQNVPSDIKRYSHEQTDEVGIPTQSKYLEDRKKRRGK